MLYLILIFHNEKVTRLYFIDAAKLVKILTEAEMDVQRDLNTHDTRNPRYQTRYKHKKLIESKALIIISFNLKKRINFKVVLHGVFHFKCCT